MVKLKSYNLNVGYPVYGARFVNENTVIVAGGGGDGNNGIPNKMTAILIQPDNTKKPIKRYRELILNDNEDSVMSLDVGNGTILAGINENSLMMNKGVNKHLRKFKFEKDHLKFIESCQIHPNTNSTIYQKITTISNDGSIGVIVMSDSPSSVYIIESSGDLEEKFKIVTDGDVKDVTISQDAKLMCYITSNIFEVISLVTGRSVFKKSFDFLMSKIRFLDNNEVIISGSKNNNSLIAKFSISSSKIIQQKTVYKNMKGITSMDVNINNNLTVLATSNYSLLLIRTSDLKVIKVLNKVHEFAITKATFSGNGRYLVSTSAANTINVVEIPDNFASSKSILLTVFHYILSIIFIALFAIGTQYLHENGYLNLMLNKAIEVYEAYKPQDSSDYFTVESIPSFETTTINSNIRTDYTTDITTTSTTTTTADSVSFTSLTPEKSSSTNTQIISSSSFLSDNDKILSTYDPKDLTISGDIISKSEITTSINYTVSTESFLAVETDETEITSIELSDNKKKFAETTMISPESTSESTFDSTSEALSEATSKSTSNSTSETSLETTTETTSDTASETTSEATSKTISETASQTTSGTVSENSALESSRQDLLKTVLTSDLSAEISKVTDTTELIIPTPLVAIKEITKEVEIIKEITSVIVSTEVQTETKIATATSTFIATEFVTTIQTNIETSVSVETSTVVHTVTKELTISTMHSPASEISIQIEPTKIVFKDSEIAIEEQEKYILEQLEVSDTISETTIVQPLETSILETSILEHDITDQPEVVTESQENSVTISKEDDGKTVEYVETTTTSTIEETAHVQIEPTKEVYTDPIQAIEAEAGKVLADLSSIEAESTEVANSKIQNRSQLTLSSITPIALLETEEPDKLSSSTIISLETQASSIAVTKDEL